MRGRPVEPREDAGKRSGETFDRVRHDRESGIGKARGIAIGVEDDGCALRLEPREHAFEDGLVAAAHAPRQSAGEHESENRRMRHAYDRPGRASVDLWIALLSICPTFAASAMATNPSRCIAAPPMPNTGNTGWLLGRERAPDLPWNRVFPQKASD